MSAAAEPLSPDVELAVERRRVEPITFGVAFCGSLFVHGILVMILLLGRLVDLSPLLDVVGPESPPPVGIIPARLVRLGERPDPNRLPDRNVPALPTAPNDGIPVSTEVDPHPVTKRNRTRPLNPVEDDKIRDVLARVRAFGEITDHITSMGDPAGVPEGDVSDPALAQAGSLWARQVARVIKAYIVFPTIIPESELAGLRCKVEVRVSADLVPEETKIAPRGTSRNHFFDQAVLDGFEQMRVKLVKLPPPPRELEGPLFGGGLILNIYGRDLE